MSDEQAITCVIIPVIWRNSMLHLIEEAVRVAIVTEKNSFDFYRSAAVVATNSSVRCLCEQLAKEKAKRLEQVMGLYPGSEFGDMESLLANPPNLTSPQHRTLLSDLTGSTGAKEALEVALQEEEICLDRYSVLMAALRAPAVHAVFQEALQATLRHCEAIREEYQRLVGWGSQDLPVREMNYHHEVQGNRTVAGLNVDAGFGVPPG
jgi:rubrerythrin